MKIALTGHRPERLRGKEKEIKQWIDSTLGNITIEEIYSGMAQGADQIIANYAISNNIPLICCYPFKKNYYHEKEKYIISKAKDTRFISEEYSKKAYWIRDKYMVDNCDVLLAVWDGIKVGGTWITVEYAQKIGKPIIYFPQEILIN